MINSIYLKSKDWLQKPVVTEKQAINALLAMGIGITLAFIFLVIFTPKANASIIDMDKIMTIESNGRNVHSKIHNEHAIGLFQITPILLKEYNSFHNSTYTRNDLFNLSLNRTIADWYLNVRIPQMLRAYRKPVTIRSVLIAYNAGVSYVVNEKALPSVTVRYLRKYGV